MPRLFLGLPLPDAVALDIQMMTGGVAGARWQIREQLHLTLHFLGDVDGGQMRRLIASLDQLSAPPFAMQLQGAGVFPPRGAPRVIWLGITEPDPVRLVHQRLAKIIDGLGIERERRKFAPHVTVARLRKQADAAAAARWVSDHALYRSDMFAVDEVNLYSSITSQRGPKYTIEASYGLDS